MIHYRKDLLQKARNNRKNMAPAEVVLRSQIRNNQFAFSFRRQTPIGNYIVDFECRSAKLIIEVDGDSHYGKEEYDSKRDDFLIGLGFKVMHFTDQEVLQDIDSVLEAIYEQLHH